MSSYITICEEAARAGGRVLLEKLGRVTVRQKAPADLVTEADFASQEVVSRTILDVFPDHDVLGEEETEDSACSRPAAEYRWIVDPLDGTTNYVHGVPHFSVSVALERRGVLLAGVVFNPVAGELFAATSGGGAFLNGETIRTSGIATMSDALAAIGFPPGVNEESPDLKAFLRTLPLFQAIRRTGSAALNLAYVAAGRFDASWSFSTRVWDMAAGVLLVQEAGGVIAAPEGGQLTLKTGHFLASAGPELHAQIEAVMATPTPIGKDIGGKKS